MVSNINCFVWFKQNNLLLQKKAFHETSLVVGWRQWPVVGDSKMLTNGVMLPVMGMMGQTSIMVRFPKIQPSIMLMLPPHPVICTYRPWSRPWWQSLLEKFQSLRSANGVVFTKLCNIWAYYIHLGDVLQTPIKLVVLGFKRNKTFKKAISDINKRWKIDKYFM